MELQESRNASIEGPGITPQMSIVSCWPRAGIDTLVSNTDVLRFNGVSPLVYAESGCRVISITRYNGACRISHRSLLAYIWFAC